MGCDGESGSFREKPRVSNLTERRVEEIASWQGTEKRKNLEA